MRDSNSVERFEICLKEICDTYVTKVMPVFQKTSLNILILASQHIEALINVFYIGLNPKKSQQCISLRC